MDERHLKLVQALGLMDPEEQAKLWQLLPEEHKLGVKMAINYQAGFDPAQTPGIKPSQFGMAGVDEGLETSFGDPGTFIALGGLGRAGGLLGRAVSPQHPRLAAGLLEGAQGAIAGYAGEGGVNNPERSRLGAGIGGAIGGAIGAATGLPVKGLLKEAVESGAPKRLQELAMLRARLEDKINQREQAKQLIKYRAEKIHAQTLPYGGDAFKGSGQLALPAPTTRTVGMAQESVRPGAILRKPSVTSEAELVPELAHKTIKDIEVAGTRPNLVGGSVNKQTVSQEFLVAKQALDKQRAIDAKAEKAQRDFLKKLMTEKQPKSRGPYKTQTIKKVEQKTKKKIKQIIQQNDMSEAADRLAMEDDAANLP